MASVASAAELGEVVRRRRKALHARQEDIALAAGTGRRFIVELEAGKPTARLSQVLDVLGALGLSLRIEYPADPGDRADA